MSIGSIGSTSSYSFIDSLVKSAMSKSNKIQGKESGFSELASKIISKNDTNGDGSLTASETKLSTSQFNSLDTNGDGKVSSDELIAGLQSNKPQGAGGPPPGGPPPGGAPPAGAPDASTIASSIIDNQDTDGDGSLSATESDLSSANFNTLDTNGDGKVSAEELAAGVKSRLSEMQSAREASASAASSLSSDQSSTSVSSASSDSESAIKSLLETLTQNTASKAYSTSSWIEKALQSSAQTLAISA